MIARLGHVLSWIFYVLAAAVVASVIFHPADWFDGFGLAVIFALVGRAVLYVLSNR